MEDVALNFRLGDAYRNEQNGLKLDAGHKDARHTTRGHTTYITDSMLHPLFRILVLENRLKIIGPHL
jgi:hypothetical protein